MMCALTRLWYEIEVVGRLSEETNLHFDFLHYGNYIENLAQHHLFLTISTNIYKYN